MECIIGACVLLVFGIALLIIGLALKMISDNFKRNSREGKAVVVGYEQSDYTTWRTLLVKIPALNQERLYSCKGGKISMSKYPKGTVIDVIYTPKRFAGIDLTEVHLKSNPPTDGMKIGNGIVYVSLAILVLACILTVIGIFTLL